MEISIKKYKGNWLLEDNGGYIGFAEHDKAIAQALKMGATTIKVQYSNQVGRTYGAEMFNADGVAKHLTKGA